MRFFYLTHRMYLKFLKNLLLYLLTYYHHFLHLHLLIMKYDKIGNFSMPIIVLFLLDDVLHVFFQLPPNLSKKFINTSNNLSIVPFLFVFELLFLVFLLHVLLFLLQSFDVFVHVQLYVDVMNLHL